MVFQPADELHGALGEALDALLENGQSAAAIAFGLRLILRDSYGTHFTGLTFHFTGLTF
jgi:hypothetical protein